MLREEVTQDQTTGNMKKPRVALWHALLARSGTMTYIPIFVVAILMFLGTSWQFFWLHTDAARYQCYALSFWMGGGAVNLLPSVQCKFLPAATLSMPPLHALPLEYPPLTLAIFSPALFAPLAYYQMAFAIFMALTAVFIYWLLLRYAPRGAALAFALYILVGAWGTAAGGRRARPAPGAVPGSPDQARRRAQRRSTRRGPAPWSACPAAPRRSSAGRSLPRWAFGARGTTCG